MKKLTTILIVTIFLGGTGFSSMPLAQSDTEALEEHMREVRRKVDEKKDSAMNTLLVMTTEQAETFRAIRKEFDEELTKLDKKDRDLIREFGKVFDTLTASTATDLGKRFFDLKRERLALEEKYLNLISDQVSPVIAVQFVQLQRRFDAQLETERMKYSPLAE